MRASSKPLAQAVSPDESVIDWIVDALVPFAMVEQQSFQQMFEAYGAYCSIYNADTI
jgi:hypothetical protein